MGAASNRSGEILGLLAIGYIVCVNSFIHEDIRLAFASRRVPDEHYRARNFRSNIVAGTIHNPSWLWLLNGVLTA